MELLKVFINRDSEVMRIEDEEHTVFRSSFDWMDPEHTIELLDALGYIVEIEEERND